MNVTTGAAAMGIFCGLLCMSCVPDKSIVTISRLFGGSRKLSFALLCSFAGSIYFVLWATGALSKTHHVQSPPRYHKNDPSRSVYFGNGCFWHTQYDFVVAEQEVGGAFGAQGRSDMNVTSLVGYAGGRYQSESGAVCYHGLATTDYSRMGHAEAVSIELSADPVEARAQVSKLAHTYFHHGFEKLEPSGRMQRLDPQDTVRSL